MLLSAASEIGVMHERIARPSRWTVQAPQSEAPQPNLVPVSPSVSRRTQRRGVAGSASAVTFLPLTVRVNDAISASCAGAAIVAGVGLTPSGALRIVRPLPGSQAKKTRGVRRE